MIARRHDWPERLAEFFESRRDRGFEWGVNDCCLFACDAILAMTDVDLAQDFRGKYSSEEGAALAILKFAGSFDRMADKIAEAHAIAAIPILMAQRGDVVMFEQQAPQGMTLGIVWMAGTHAVSLGLDGQVRVPVYGSECRKAWRIG
jgi:hypothetical protein